MTSASAVMGKVVKEKCVPWEHFISARDPLWYHHQRKMNRPQGTQELDKALTPRRRAARLSWAMMNRPYRDGIQTFF